MQSRNWVPVMPLASWFLLQATASYGQEAIGKATSVRPQAAGIHSGSTRTLSGGSDVYSKEIVRIRTGDTGQVNLQKDDINLSVGPKSSVDLDKYVYDPNKSAGTIAVQAERGSLRFVTGSQGGGSYQIQTPYGTLGNPYYGANPTELRNSRQASQRGSKTSAKSEKAIAVKNESPRHRANTTPAIKITTVKPKTVAVAAKPTAAKPRNQTEPVEEKANSWTITKPEVPPSTQPLATPDPVPKKETTAIGGKAEGPVTGQPSETSDPVLKKAKITVAARMEDPASVEFVDMKRATNKNTVGQSFEIICGHVKGKKESGEATGERPFLYLVMADEAYIVDRSNPDSMAGIVYRAHCTSANSR